MYTLTAESSQHYIICRDKYLCSVAMRSSIAIRPSRHEQQPGVPRLTVTGCCVLTPESNEGVVYGDSVRYTGTGYTSSTDISIGRHIRCLVYKGTHLPNKSGTSLLSNRPRSHVLLVRFSRLCVQVFTGMRHPRRDRCHRCLLEFNLSR